MGENGRTRPARHGASNQCCEVLGGNRQGAKQVVELAASEESYRADAEKCRLAQRSDRSIPAFSNGGERTDAGKTGGPAHAGSTAEPGVDGVAASGERG